MEPSILSLPRPPTYSLARSQRVLRWSPSFAPMRYENDGKRVWRCTRTPDGPATYRMTEDTDRIEVAAWGDGARWVLERAGDLLGLHDRPETFQPDHPELARLLKKHPTPHMPKAHRVYECLVPPICHQLIIGADAIEAVLKLDWRFGERAPGPVKLWLHPDPKLLKRVALSALFPIGIARKQAATLRRVAERAHRMDEAAEWDSERAAKRMMAIPGVGPWTANYVLAKGLGDADAVPVGDYHLKNQVSWALAGEPRGTDERMLELLEPFRPHRYRVLMLIQTAGIKAPRYGPKLARRKLQ